MSEIIRPGAPYEQPKLTPEQEQLNKLSYPAYAYIVMGRAIEGAPPKVAELLKTERLKSYNLLDLSQRAEVVEFGQWWTKQIKQGHEH